jgi:hypothetical protein
LPRPFLRSCSLSQAVAQLSTPAAAPCPV